MAWSNISALIDRLLDTPPERREALIAELSGGDPARRAELQALLAECVTEPAFLRAPAAERFLGLFHDESRFPPSLADRYRLIRELGRGGMATVHLAHDMKHHRDVAVK